MRTLLAFCCVLAAVAAEYRFTVDGAPVEPVVVPLTPGPTHPAPGDLVRLGDLPLILGEAGAYAFATAGALLTEPGAEPAPARLDLGADPAPLLALDAAQRRRLRLIVLRDPAALTPALRAALADADAARAVLDLDVGAPGVVPELPADWRHLVVRRSAPAATGVRLDGLRDHASLRWLHLVELGQEVGVTPLEGCTALRRLSCVRAQLPARSVYRLMRVRPDLAIDPGWFEALRTAFAATDRVVVRQRGKGDGLVGEERDPQRIADLFAALEVTASGPSCLCFGQVVIELESRGAIIASLSLHHGRALRWSPRMPLDGRLAPAALDRFAAWLAAHGVPDAAREWEQARQDADAPPRTRFFWGDEEIGAEVPDPDTPPSIP